MAIGIEKYKTMQIPVPEDEEILLIPRTLYWGGEWKDAILVFTNKGIHFRVRKDRILGVKYCTLRNGHDMLENTFFPYKRIQAFAQGSGLWKTTVTIQMVDQEAVRFGFHKDIATVMQLLVKYVQPGAPKDMQYYNYSAPNPEKVAHQMISAPK